MAVAEISLLCFKLPMTQPLHHLVPLFISRRTAPHHHLHTKQDAGGWSWPIRHSDSKEYQGYPLRGGSTLRYQSEHYYTPCIRATRLQELRTLHRHGCHWCNGYMHRVCFYPTERSVHEVEIGENCLYSQQLPDKTM